jgi:cell division septum initiation protein DivIVA
MCVTAVLVAIAATGALAQQGFRQTDRLMSRAENSARAIEDTKGELQRTLEAYNSMFDGSAKNPRRAYQISLRGVERSEKRVGDIQKRLNEMQIEADKYFADWTTSLDAIINQDLRRRSEARRDETRAGYDNIHQAALKAVAEYETFIGNFRDQLMFLGHDLNPSSISSLKEDAGKLNGEAAQLFSEADGSLTVIRTLIDNISPLGGVVQGVQAGGLQQ